MSKKIMFISGEASGDMHGASLMGALGEIMGPITFSGMGGLNMRRAGLKGLDFKEVSVVGLVEVLKKLLIIRKTLKELKRKLASERPDCLVLIDFPDFNLRLAAEAKKLGIPVVYYISPQVWAWRKGRIKKIARLVDKMLVVFPFEVPLYKAEGVDVEFVGHPLGDTSHCDLTKAQAKAEFGYKRTVSVVSILPGSRVEEVNQLLKPMLNGAELSGEYSRWVVRFILHAADSIDDALIGEMLKDHPIKDKLQIVRGADRIKALRASDAAVITSGTATLEAALIGTPMVIVYKLSPLSYIIGRFLLRIKHIGLPNIFMKKTVVNELLQGKVNTEEISGEILRLLEAPNEVEFMEQDYEVIQKALGEPGASKNAALAIKKLIG